MITEITDYKVIPAWVYMWLVALGLYAATKWVLIAQSWFSLKSNRRRLIFYVLFWPGMDAHAFCEPARVRAPSIHEWLFAAGKTLLGGLLLWLGVPFVRQSHPLVRGWLGMLSIVLMLHFGVFDLISLFWRSRGVDAKPLMRSPLTATSLSRFWALRWNTGFSDLVRACVFKPLSHRLGGRGALFVAFVVSGLLHELVITVPALGGYGLPTAYFLLQATGVLFERSQAGRRLGLGGGWKGWCFVALVAGLPSFGLFPPVFIRNVILPMLYAIGAS